MCNNKEHSHGETCCGGHGHEHSHEEGCCGGKHEHSHDEGCCHTHEHDHAHPHEGGVRSPEDTLKLLTYMLDHNRHHGDDLHEIFHALEAVGQAEAAAHVHEAMHQFDHGNNKLEEALKLLGGK